ncbi:MAG: hypothetical protein ACK55Z_37970, partial [bacterium]
MLFSRSIPSLPLYPLPPLTQKPIALQRQEQEGRLSLPFVASYGWVGLCCLHPSDPLTLHRVSSSANTQDRHQGPGVLQAPSPSSLFIDSHPCASCDSQASFHVW